MNGLDLDLFLRLVQTDFAAWLLLALVVLGLIVAVWAGVGSHKALRKCLLLSVVAHILLMRYGQPVEWTRSGLGVLGSAADQIPDATQPLSPGIRSLEILDIDNAGQLEGSSSSSGKSSTNGAGGRVGAGGILPSDIPDALPEFTSNTPRIDRPDVPQPELALNDRVKRQQPELPTAEIADTLPVEKPLPEKRQDPKLETSVASTEPDLKTLPVAATADEIKKTAPVNPVQSPSQAAPLPTPADAGRRQMAAPRTTPSPDAALPKSVMNKPEVTLPKVDIGPNLALQAPARPMPEPRTNVASESMNRAGSAPAISLPAQDIAPPIPVLEALGESNSDKGGNKPSANAVIASLTNPATAVPDRDLRSRIRNRDSDQKPTGDLAVNLPRPKSEVVLPKPDLTELSGVSLLNDRRNRPASRPLEDVPLVYRSRLDPNRAKLAIAAGASGASEKAVEMALDWLRSHQDADGRWDGGVAKYRDGSVASEEDSFTVHCPPGDICFGECYYWEADTALTGLSLLAYLGAGYTHTEGKYADTVTRGLDFLIRSQKPDGDLRGKSVAVGMYCHAMATLAMCEAYALTGDERIKNSASKAITFLVDSQAENGAAWRYEPRAPVGDTSILGWVVLALRSGRSLGFTVPDKTVEGIDNWLKSVSSGKNGGLAKYQPWKEVTPTMTAEAWLCRWFLNLDPNAGRNQEASDFLLEHGPDRDPYNLYYWYYGTLSMYQNGGSKWEKWNSLVRDRIVDKQKTKGHQTGSWDPDDSTWGTYGGRIYNTALATLTLEVYYRFLRLYEDPQLKPSN